MTPAKGYVAAFGCQLRGQLYRALIPGKMPTRPGVTMTIAECPGCGGEHSCQVQGRKLRKDEQIDVYLAADALNGSGAPKKKRPPLTEQEITAALTSAPQTVGEVAKQLDVAPQALGRRAREIADAGGPIVIGETRRQRIILSVSEP